MRIPAFFLVVLCMTGCGGLKAPGQLGAEPNLAPYVGVVKQDQAAQEGPLALEITQVLNDGRLLHVFGLVSVRTDWDLSRVALRLMGLRGGQIHYENTRRLSDSLVSEAAVSMVLDPDLAAYKPAPGRLAAGSREAFYLAIPAEGIGNYQLELLWGEEALSFLPLSAGRAEQLVELRNVQLEGAEQDCRAGCDANLRISLDLFNASSRALERVVLGVGYVRSNQGADLDLSQTVPENEEHVEIEALQLLPGHSRQVRLVFEKPAGRLAAEHLKPAVRILEAH